jgi:hypothetical protein
MPLMQSPHSLYPGCYVQSPNGKCQLVFQSEWLSGAGRKGGSDKAVTLEGVMTMFWHPAGSDDNPRLDY